MIEYAALCKDAGLLDNARDILEDALKNAWMGLQDEALCKEIDALIAALQRLANVPVTARR